MRDYRLMSPCERVRYYRARLRALDTGPRPGASALAGALERLIAENLPRCPDEDERSRARAPSLENGGVDPR